MRVVAGETVVARRLPQARVERPSRLRYSCRLPHRGRFDGRPTQAPPRHLPAAHLVHDGQPVLRLLQPDRVVARATTSSRRCSSSPPESWTASTAASRVSPGRPRSSASSSTRWPTSRRSGSRRPFWRYEWALQPFHRVGWLIAFLFVACAATRLARFNIQHGSSDKRFFAGLPSPAAAGSRSRASRSHFRSRRRSSGIRCLIGVLVAAAALLDGVAHPLPVVQGPRSESPRSYLSVVRDRARARRGVRPPALADGDRRGLSAVGAGGLVRGLDLTRGRGQRDELATPPGGGGRRWRVRPLILPPDASPVLGAASPAGAHLRAALADRGVPGDRVAFYGRAREVAVLSGVRRRGPAGAGRPTSWMPPSARRVFVCEPAPDDGRLSSKRRPGGTRRRRHDGLVAGSRARRIVAGADAGSRASSRFRTRSPACFRRSWVPSTGRSASRASPPSSRGPRPISASPVSRSCASRPCTCSAFESTPDRGVRTAAGVQRRAGAPVPGRREARRGARSFERSRRCSARRSSRSPCRRRWSPRFSATRIAAHLDPAARSRAAEALAAWRRHPGIEIATDPDDRRDPRRPGEHGSRHHARRRGRSRRLCASGRSDPSRARRPPRARSPRVLQPASCECGRESALRAPSWRCATCVCTAAGRFLSVITMISVAGVAVGTAALVIALALMTGFEEDMRQRILREAAPTSRSSSRRSPASTTPTACWSTGPRDPRRRGRRPRPLLAGDDHERRSGIAGVRARSTGSSPSFRARSSISASRPGSDPLAVLSRSRRERPRRGSCWGPIWPRGWRCARAIWFAFWSRRSG